MIKGIGYKIEPIDKKCYDIFVRIKRDGKEYLRQQKGFIGTKTESVRRAEEIVAELIKKAETSVAAKGSCSLTYLKTFGECVIFYKARDHKWYSNKCHLDRVEIEFQKTSIDAIQVECEDFLTRMEHTLTEKGTCYSHHQLNRWIERVSRVVTFCKEKKVIPQNVHFSIKKYHTEPREVNISQSDVVKLLESIKLHRPYLLPITEFALKIPARLGELLKLEKEFVFADEEVLRIKGSNSKNGKGVTKPIPPQQNEYFATIPDDVSNAFFRVDQNGNRVPLKRFTKAWTYCVEQSGIGKNIRFHDLRHFSASQMLNKGLPERQIMDIAGWKTNMLSTYFQKDSVESSKAALNLMKTGLL